MGVPISQVWKVASYVIGKRMRGIKRYPLVLMLEPLFRCNLSCAGCGKIQHPADVLRRHLTPEECFGAVDECGAPIISIPGGIHRSMKLSKGWSSGENTSICVPTHLNCENPWAVSNPVGIFLFRYTWMVLERNMIRPYVVKAFTT